MNSSTAFRALVRKDLVLYFSNRRALVMSILAPIVIAAFFGATMNMSFLLAGSASMNPVLFALAIGLILAWKVSGYYGLDRYILPLLGTPWRPGHIAGRDTHPAGANAG